MTKKKQSSKSSSKKSQAKQADQKAEKVEVHKIKGPEAKGSRYGAGKKSKLLDDKLKQKPEPYKSGMFLTFLAFLIFALAVFGYFFFTGGEAERLEEQAERPAIVVPEEVSEQLEEETEDTDEEPVVVEILQVRILETPTGWLNVRTGPGTNYEIIGRVNPGESYAYISEDEDSGWYEIQLSGGTGWLTGQYAELETTTTTRETTE